MGRRVRILNAGIPKREISFFRIAETGLVWPLEKLGRQVHRQDANATLANQA
jgi:hypothetical protein